jgi:translation elongation factor EF-G
MDACIHYLPSPDEKEPIKSTTANVMPRKPIKSEKLTAYCYKVVN